MLEERTYQHGMAAEGGQLRADARFELLTLLQRPFSA